MKRYLCARFGLLILLLPCHFEPNSKGLVARLWHHGVAAARGVQTRRRGGTFNLTFPVLPRRHVTKMRREKSPGPQQLMYDTSHTHMMPF